jgi:O-antigen/teichoic acid export membrane protein
MIKKAISKVFLIISSVACLQIISTILLARHFNKSEMGLYRLILTIVELGTMVSLFGSDYSLVRFFSKEETAFHAYDWMSFVKKIFIVSLVLIAVCTAFGTILYGFDTWAIITLPILMSLLASIFLFSALLRAQRKYTLAIFFNRCNFAIFFLFIITLYFLRSLTLSAAFSSFIIAASIANGILIYYCKKHIPAGDKKIPLAVFKNSFPYFGLGVTILLILQTGPLLIGKILSYRELAIYVVIASLMRIFEFSQDASYYVLVPYMNAKDTIPMKKLFLGVLAMGIAISLFYAFSGTFIINLCFRGLYNEGKYLLPYFIAIGLIRTLYILPASFIGGRSSEATLRHLFYITAIASLLNLLLSYFFILKWQLRGAAWAQIVTWSFVVIASWCMIRRYSDKTSEGSLKYEAAVALTPET